MPQFEKGNLVFTSKDAGDALGTPDVFEEYECHPKPNGTVRRANPELTRKPELLSAYLQKAEGERIVEAAGGGDFASINTEVFRALGFKPLTADTSKVPAGWRAVRPCYKTTILLVFHLNVCRVDVTAKAAAKIGGIAYPAGDIVASYRALVPDQYRYELRFEFDKRCCDKAPEHPPHGEVTKWYPDWSIEFDPHLEWKIKPHLRMIPEHDKDWPGLRFKFEYKF